MTRCAEPTMRFPIASRHPAASRWLLTVMAAAVLAGCQAPASKPAAPKAEPSPPVAVQKPAAPSKGDPDERFKAALKLLKDRQSKEAREAFFNLAKDFPEFSGPFADLAIVQAQAKQPQLAIANFEKATRLNPQNALAWNWLGTLYREGNDFPKAEAAYTIGARDQAGLRRRSPEPRHPERRLPASSADGADALSRIPADHQWRTSDRSRVDP